MSEHRGPLTDAERNAWEEMKQRFHTSFNAPVTVLELDAALRAALARAERAEKNCAAWQDRSEINGRNAFKLQDERDALRAKLGELNRIIRCELGWIELSVNAIMPHVPKDIVVERVAEKWASVLAIKNALAEITQDTAE